MSLRNKLTILEPQRDHPRLVAGPQNLFRGYGANYDFQLVLLPLNNVESISTCDVMRWCHTYINNFNTLPEVEKINLKKSNINVK